MTSTKSNAKFVVELDGGVEGPMSGSEVRDLALAGKVTPRPTSPRSKEPMPHCNGYPPNALRGLKRIDSPVIKEPADVPANYNEPIRKMV